MKLKGERTYYFAIPLQEIHLKKYDYHFSKKYGFCSFYFPSIYQDPEDFLYLIKVYDYFDDSSKMNIDLLNERKLLFGESLYFPFIPTRGEMKWILIGEKEGERRLEDFPDLRISSLPTTIHPEKRNWFLVKNADLKEENWEMNQRTYPEIKHLELAERMSEPSVKLRIYISVLKKDFAKKKIKIDIVEWRKILFEIMITETAAKKTKEKALNEFIESFVYDYTNIWE